MKRCIALLIASLSVGADAFCQWTNTMQQRGFTPGASFDGSGLDSVNMVNGNVVVTIPITSLPAGPGGSGLDFSLTYNAAVWTAGKLWLGDPNSPGSPPVVTTRLKGADAAWLLGNNYGLRTEIRPNNVTPDGQMSDPTIDGGSVGGPSGQCTAAPGAPANPDAYSPDEAKYPFRTRLVFPDGSQHILYLQNASTYTSGGWVSTRVEDGADGGGWYPYDVHGTTTVSCLSFIPLYMGGPFNYYTVDGTRVRVAVSPTSNAGSLTSALVQVGTTQTVAAWTTEGGANANGGTGGISANVPLTGTATTSQTINSTVGGGFQAVIDSAAKSQTIALKPVDPGWDYRVVVSDGKLVPYENGEAKTPTTGAAGDTLKISIEGSQVKYYRNGNVFYTAAVAPSGNYNGYWAANARPVAVWTAYFPDGRVVAGVEGQTNTIKDRNNNTINVVHEMVSCGTQAACSQTSYVDSYNRAVIIRSEANGQSTVRQTGFGGTDLVWTLTWAGNTISSSPTPCVYIASGSLASDNCSYLASQVMLTQVDLPFPGFSTQLSYAFNYHATASSGNLHGITLPYGATIEYDYNAGDGAVNTWAVTRKLLTYHYPDATPAQAKVDIWDYDILPWVGSQPTGSNGICSQVKNPDEGIVRHCYYPTSGTLYGVPGHTYQILQPDGSKVENVWAASSQVGDGYANPYIKTELSTLAGSSPVRTTAKDYTIDRNGNTRFVKEYKFVDEYSISGFPGNYHVGGDLGPLQNVACNAGTGMLCPASASPIRTTETVYSTASVLDVAYPASASANNTSPAADEYSQPTAPRLLTAPQSVKITDLPSASTGLNTSFTSFEYDGATSTGNLITELHWDSTKVGTMPGALSPSNAIVTSRTYTAKGDLRTVVDPNGVRTEYVYEDTTYNNLTAGHPYPTGMCVACQTSDSRSWSFQWERNTGLRRSETDVENSVSTVVDYDARGRTVCVAQQDGAASTPPSCNSGIRKTVTTYSDAADTTNRGPKITISSSIGGFTTLGAVTTQYMDDLGRAWKTEIADPDGTTYTQSLARTESHTQTQTPLASYTLTSNPYRSTSDATMGWTRTKRDKNGRVVEVESFAGTVMPPPWGSNTTSTGMTTTDYLGFTTRVTESAVDGNVVKDSEADALGRLKTVTEYPVPGSSSTSYTTAYTYDLQDKLRTVTQGSQTRTFVYTSLGRLKSADNPESGGINYAYDNVGNLIKRTDARGAILCFGVLTSTSCDGVNSTTGANAWTGYNHRSQATKKTYYAPSGVEATPMVNYTYGGCARGAGRLCQVDTSGVGITSFTYNNLGQIAGSSQSVNGLAGSPFSFSYEYELNDALKKITYPSGRIVEYQMGATGRVTRVAKGELSSQESYATGITYAPQGALKSLTFGITATAVTETWTHNARLQPTRVQTGSLLTIDYAYCASQAANCQNNNGNLRLQAITRNGFSTAWTQNYSYDGVNRLKTSAESGQGIWNDTFAYDAKGNRWICAHSGLPQLTLETPQNLGDCTTTGWFDGLNRVSSWTYDASGNLLGMPSPLQRVFTYDAENRQIKATIDSALSTYTYDGDGRRVKAVTPSGTTYFIYDAAGQLAAEYGPNTDTDTQFVTADHLGSTRLLVKNDGTPAKCYDYLPFGETIPSTAGMGRSTTCFTGAVDNTINFTGKERDAETGLDYFGARYMSAAQGRFTSPDEPLIDQNPADPQSWNLYSYVRNNPLIFTDPTGNDCVYVNGAGNGIDSINNQNTAKDCGKTGGYWVDGTVTNARFAHGGLILTGTTDGTNRTQASYALGPDPGLLALQRGTQLAEPLVKPLAAATLGFVAAAGIVAAAPVAAATPGFIPQIINVAGKQAARAAIQNMGLPAAQAAAAVAAIARATSTSSIQIMRQGQNLIVQISRAGRNGYQVIESVIDQAGGKQVVQKAYDAANTLVHYDPKK